MKLNGRTARGARASAAPLFALALSLAGCAAANARPQQPAAKPADNSAPHRSASDAGGKSPAKSAALSPAASPAELARAAYRSLGGDRFRDLRNMVLSGSLDLYSPASTQGITGRFGVVTAGEKIRQEMQSPFFSATIIYDGVQNYSSIRGFEMPPPSKYGLPVLVKHAQPGFAVTALPDKDSKKTRAFRVTGPEGNATDFRVDAATGRLVGYEVPYGGVTYVVEIKETKEIDGVTVPVKFAQRLATPQGTFIAEFKVRDARLNQDLPEDAFAIPAK
jgi:lipoprotein-anchoring transpeptidase ErfK/SrfK